MEYNHRIIAADRDCWKRKMTSCYLGEIRSIYLISSRCVALDAVDSSVTTYMLRVRTLSCMLLAARNGRSLESSKKKEWFILHDPSWFWWTTFPFDSADHPRNHKSIICVQRNCRCCRDRKSVNKSNDWLPTKYRSRSRFITEVTKSDFHLLLAVLSGDWRTRKLLHMNDFNHSINPSQSYTRPKADASLKVAIELREDNIFDIKCD